MLRLERMEICGFKSFSDRTELRFPPGITGVVGPNGCGKSNIADAINWVLGEQSPKSLRGRQMADVIFNGTEARKALGLAEVTLVFAGAEGLPHQEQGQVSITRRLYRSGDSEYRLNGVRTRLMDIQELLREGKVGARTYATIEQGRIDQVLNAKPRERRALIEDAAGVSGYKHKRRLAELRLEATHANLLRVNDIVGEVQRQIQSLKRQAARARRYRRLREELRAREAQRFARRAWELDLRLEQAREAAQAARQREAEAAGQLGLVEASLIHEREQLETARRERRELAERQHHIALEMDRAEAQVRACRERIAEAEAAAQQQRDEGETVAAREREAAERAERQRLELESGRADRERLQSEAEQAQRELERLDAAQREARRAIEDLRAQQFHAMSQAADVRNRRRSAEEAVARALAMRERSSAQLAEIAADVERLRADAERRAEQALAVEHEVSRLREAQRRDEADLQAARSRHEDAGQQLAAAREAQEAAVSRLATLEDIETRFTGVSDGVRALLCAEPSRGIRAHGVVADYLQATRELEGAAESYLQWLLPAVVLEDDGDARRAADFLRAAGAGRTALISRDHPVGALAVGCRGNGHSALPPELMRDGRVRGRLLDGLKLDPAANGAVAERIGDAVLVDDLASALELHRRHPQLDYVTADGDVVYASGVISAGGGRPAQHGLLAHRRRLEEARAAATQAAALAADGRGSVETLREAVLALESRMASGREALAAAERGGVEARLAAERLRAEAEQAGRRQQVLTAEREALELEALPLAEAERRSTDEVAEAEQVHEATAAALAEQIARHDAGEQQLKLQLERVAELRGRAASAGQRQAASEREAQTLAEQLAELRTRRGRLETGVDTFGERARAAAGLLAETEVELGRSLGERERLASAATACDEATSALEQLLAARELELRERRGGLEGLREASREAELERTRSESTRENLDALCLQELEQTASAALAATPQVAELDPAALEAEATEIRQAIERIGPVNMTAIEEFSDLEERHEFLTAQRADLDSSMESLRESIRRIDRESRRRFEEAFEAVRSSFQETYRLLFAGGRADLRLEEGEDVLECGIEILAQPPGKRLAGVHLLSGGEKALSAIALLFAIFRFQPSPFCLLDEVDAALDEANVGRFMRMVREYGKHTQFIIVTHNKLTMEAANLLYGVTMEERGVSKVMSLQLQ